jgi:lipopolysaccharide transport system ATP-binding protein
MNAPVLQVSRLGKAYRQYNSELSRVLTWFGLPAKPHSETWVLKDVSFCVHPGEAVGIVGQNGAGKSTLLKLVTGTQRPTTGSITVNGRIGAMLELGMGFNPEFTARENAYHSAGLMGFGRGIIDSVMPEIESFAEIGEYFDQPICTYSSGMQMRVAFAVVTAFRPDILIVDEALSVGDSYFQHKSVSRIREFQEQGTTLLIVSHDPGAIKSLCNRALLLENGILIKDGGPEEVMDYYNALIAEKEGNSIETKRVEQDRTQTTSGTRDAQVKEITMLNELGKSIDIVNVGQLVQLKVDICIHENLPELVFGYMIKDRLGQVVFGTNTYHLGLPLKDLKKGESLSLKLSFPANFGQGSYSVTSALHSGNTHIGGNFEWRDLAFLFNVVNHDKANFVGVSWIPPKIEYRR